MRGGGAGLWRLEEAIIGWRNYGGCSLEGCDGGWCAAVQALLVASFTLLSIHIVVNVMLGRMPKCYYKCLVITVLLQVTTTDQRDKDDIDALEE